jgi:hypothetical protein
VRLIIGFHIFQPKGGGGSEVIIFIYFTLYIFCTRQIPEVESETPPPRFAPVNVQSLRPQASEGLTIQNMQPLVLQSTVYALSRMQVVQQSQNV